MTQLQSVVLPFVAIGVLLAIGAVLVLPLISEQIVSLREELPKYIESTSRLVEDTETRVNVLFGSLYEFDFSRNLERFLIFQSGRFFESVPHIITTTVTVMLLGPFFSFFMLFDGRNVSRRLLGLVPNNLFELALHLFHQINRQMGDFVRARILEAAIVGLIVWLGLQIIQFPYAFLLAVFAGVTNLIPYLGPVIGAIPAIAISLANADPTIQFAFMITVYAIAQVVDSVYLIPFLVSKIVDLHPVTVVVVIIIGAQAMGVLGMIISIPLASIFKVTSMAIYNHLLDFRS